MPADLYRTAAPIYDACTALWSGGAIWRSRLCQVAHMTANMPVESRILYPGGGSGRAAVQAALHGMNVTLLDRSPAMLRRATDRAKRAGVSIVCKEGDAWNWQPEMQFDGICANHFFNVFARDPMEAMRARLLELLKPSGFLYVADFRPPTGSALLQGLQRLHHWIPLSGCRAFTGNAMHPIYDHSDWQGPWHSVEVVDHRAWKLGPGWYRTWFFQQDGDGRRS